MFPIGIMQDNGLYLRKKLEDNGRYYSLYVIGKVENVNSANFARRYIVSTYQVTVSNFVYKQSRYTKIVYYRL